MHIEHKQRCFGSKPNQEFYANYHDTEWGVPVYDDQKLFELLILEGAQAGLSWETILKRRAGYAQAFYNFDPLLVAKMDDQQLEQLRDNVNIIRNRLKIYATRRNAQVFLAIQEEFGSFAKYLWSFVDHKTIKSKYLTFQDMPVQNGPSIALSKDLVKRGMTFVGPKIMYAYMQAVGLFNDHLTTCFLYQD